MKIRTKYFPSFPAWLAWIEPTTPLGKWYFQDPSMDAWTLEGALRKMVNEEITEDEIRAAWVRYEQAEAKGLE